MAILKEGYNCWQIFQEARASFLIYGAAYFEALADAVEQAQKAICIAAWDIDSRIQLRHGSFRTGRKWTNENAATDKNHGRIADFARTGCRLALDSSFRVD